MDESRRQFFQVGLAAVAAMLMPKKKFTEPTFYRFRDVVPVYGGHRAGLVAYVDDKNVLHLLDERTVTSLETK